MKHLVCLMLSFCLCLSGCSTPGQWIKEPVKFYYIHGDYQQDMEEVIVSEIREASGHREDLPYLLALYSMGPTNADYKSPFPPNTVILPIEHSGGNIVLSLSENALRLTDVEYTIASACIAMTCMEITDTQQVSVVCEDKSVTIGKDNLLLSGSVDQKDQEEGS